jgi:hypothetical protein
MIYLLEQFRIAVLLALVLGGLVGWFFLPRRPGTWRSGSAPFALAALAAGAAAAVLRQLPGMPGLMLDTAVLFSAAYVLGCLIGASLRALFGRETRPGEPAVVTAEAPMCDPPPDVPSGVVAMAEQPASSDLPG